MDLRLPVPNRPSVRRAAPGPARLRRGARLAALLAGLLAVDPRVLAQIGTAGGEPPNLRLPALGESASDDFPLSAEKRLGEQIMREIRRDPDYMDDPPLLDYLQSIWQPLVAAARERGDIGADTERLFPYESFLVRDRTVNAFALPGGYVGVNLGLIAMTATPDELASVLAHELSHVTQRHIARSIGASSRTSTLGLAALILGMLAASRSSSADVANAAIMGSQAAVAQAQLSFSRDMEREADRNGLALMSLGGFAPSGMAEMFDKLDVASRLNDSGGYPWLRSHPLTTERIGEVRQRISLMTSPLASTHTLRHALMQARARVLMDPTASAWRRLQGFDQAEASALGGEAATPLLSGLYASALASSKLRDFARADRALAAARAALERAAAGAGIADLTGARRALDELGVQIALAAGKADNARAAIAAMASDGSRADVMLRAEVALAGTNADALRQCSESLQTWVAERRGDSRGWQLLSQCAARQGQPLRALRAEAEAQAAIDNLPGAIDRLRAGQQLARRSGAAADFIEASVIESRLRDLLALQRQRMDEAGRRRGNTSGDSPQP
jgi:beta-barrel assembly-enhancing protease